MVWVIFRVIGRGADLAHPSHPGSPTDRDSQARTISLEEVQARCCRDGFGTSAHAQLAIDTADLGLDRVGGNDERLCHLHVGLPGTKPPQHQLLLPGEWLDEHSWDSTPPCLRPRLW